MSSRPFDHRMACVRIREAACSFRGRPAWRPCARAGRPARLIGALALALALWLGVLGAGVAAPGAETRVYKRVAPAETGAAPRELRLFVDKPADWKPGDRRPAVVFFFGGGWVGGTPEQFRPQSEYFASRGLVGIRVEYRTLPKGDSGPPVWCCADAKSAMRHVRARAAELGIDPDRIAAAGGSAGGHLAAFTALVDGLDEPGEERSVSCRPNALVLFNPVFNNGPGEWGHARVGERFREFSPAHHVTSNAPPTVVFLGDADRLIPVRVVREFETSMRSVGARCEAHITPGAGHGFFNREPHLSRTLIQADRFLAALGWLQGAPTRAMPAEAGAGARPGEAGR